MRQNVSAVEVMQRGFTLIEMSVVLIIIGLVIAIIFPTLMITRKSMQESTTQANMTSVVRAIAAFTQANGCVPCPTKASASSSGMGRVRGDTVASPCGACIVPEGIIPFVSLGIPVSMAKDGWGHWITYRVDPALTTNTTNVIPPASVCLSSDPAPCVLGESRKGLCRADLGTTTTHPLVDIQSGATEKSAIVLVSHGANGFGAFQNDMINHGYDDAHPLYAGPSTDEAKNADGDRNFYQGVASPDPVTYFDDILLYLSRNALVAYLGNQGCQTPW